MSKKAIVLVGLIVLIIIAGIAYFVNQNSNGSERNNNNQKRIENQAQTNNQASNREGVQDDNYTNIHTDDGKTLVVYFSAQGHTEEVAQKIANNLGADIFEIVPTEQYTSDDLDWTDSNSRVSREYEDESLRNTELVSTSVDNWEEYDTVLIGYPIWWGIAAWPVDTFVKANDFSGKTVLTFCTSSSSGLGQSGKLLADEANSGNWLEGQRFRFNASDSDINNWTDSIK